MTGQLLYDWIQGGTGICSLSHRLLEEIKKGLYLNGKQNELLPLASLEPTEGP
jgi:hypothetical protein